MKNIFNIFLLMIILSGNLLSQELISDTHFQDGLIVFNQKSPPDNPIKIDGQLTYDSTTKPIWDCAQWSSKSTIIGISPTLLDNGWNHWENGEKKIYMGPVGKEDYDLLLGVNSYNEYDGVYRQLGESWPHLLVEQRLSPPNTAGPGSPSMDNVAKLDFHVETKLENDSTIIHSGYDSNIHAAQFLIYFTLQNLNPNSSGYGKDYIWLGVQIYDDRNERPDEYINHDDGTQTLIYSIDYDSVANKSVHSNEWVEFNVDLYPYAIKALTKAWQRGYLSASQDLADYKLGGMNMGWELPGMNIGDMKIRNLSLIASNETTDITEINGDHLEFNLFQNYPNPFNPSTVISYYISSSERELSRSNSLKVTLKVYDTLGREVAMLVNKEQQPGNYEVVFNAVGLPSGIYFSRLTVANNSVSISQIYSGTKKIILLK